MHDTSDITRALCEASDGLPDTIDSLVDPFWEDDTTSPMSSVRQRLESYLADPEIPLDPSEVPELDTIELCRLGLREGVLRS